MLELDCGANPGLGTALTLAGYLVGAAVLALAWAASGTRRLIAPQHWVLIGLAALLCGILGARLTQWLVLGWPHFRAGAILDPQAGGRTIIGGIVCGWLGVEGAKALLKVKFSTGEPFALALPAGEAIGRLGCFFKGCCGGAATHVPWAVTADGRLVHPSQLYASGAALLTLLILLWLRPRLRHPGDLFYWYLIFFGVFRFGIEFTRAQSGLWWGLSTGQWFAAELALSGALALWLASRHRRRIGRAAQPEMNV